MTEPSFNEKPLGASASSPGKRHVLKSGDTFVITDDSGNIHDGGDLGLYYLGTRHLSRLALTLEGGRLLDLSATVSSDNVELTAHLMNDVLARTEGAPAPRGSLHLQRSSVVLEGQRYERIELTNFELTSLPVTLRWSVSSDFADIFEVRGTPRARRGTLLRPDFSDGVLTLAYHGLDSVPRRTHIEITPPPISDGAGGLELRLSIGARSTETVYVSVACQQEDTPLESSGFEAAQQGARLALSRFSMEGGQLESSDPALSAWLDRSVHDLGMMSVGTARGRYVHAGVPWFSTLFGRDSLITALSTAWINPALARGTLEVLAQLQAETSDAKSDAEPGKILHEARAGEMAALGEVPFAKYYGSVDSTPLFVMLAAEYLRVSGDLRFLEALLPNVRRALSWIEQFGDRDGDGFVEYGRRSSDGLIQQGWKDSHDSVFHADGTDAEGPIALCEVQGYVYAAQRGAARIFEALGQVEEAHALDEKAHSLQGRFDRAFWCERSGMYAMALDGDKAQCRVRSSNVGHCLWTGIVLPERIPRLRRELLADDLFSGWGLRTLSTREVRYNPLSYHNGSVWPHDTAIAAAGLAGYGCTEEAERLFSGLLALSRQVESGRLPELICGFPRVAPEPPVLYPVACSPQAWASAAVFMILGASLDLPSLHGHQRWERDRAPSPSRGLPPGVDWIRLNGLPLGTERRDLELSRNSLLLERS